MPTSIARQAAYFLLPGLRRLRDSRDMIMRERDALLSERDASSSRQRNMEAALADARGERDRLKLELAAMEQDIRQLRDAVARSEQRIADMHATWAKLNHVVGFNVHRVEYLLAGQEGILAQAEEFHAARRTPEYRAAFTAPEPLVSVTVITAHRPELLVSRCLDSLRNQTYRNLQIIVVGDHCIDDTESRVAELQDDRIVFHNLPARGPYPPPGWDRWAVAGTYPANKALSMCEGQFICHLDDDDRYEPERIETMVAAAQLHEADLCWNTFHWQLPDESWRILGNGRFEMDEVGTGSIFYHRYFARIQDDVFAYRVGEPGDWNRLRKIKMLRPKLHFVDKPLTWHYVGSEREPFVAQPGETFLD